MNAKSPKPQPPTGKVSPEPTAKRGPRGGTEDVKAQILVAARECFSRDGYQATTIKAIAARAGVDTRLVHYYFGAKRDLFATLISQVFSSYGLLQEFFTAARAGQPGGVQYIRQVLTLLETTPEGEVFIGLIRSLGTHQESQEIMLAFVSNTLNNIMGSSMSHEFQFRTSLVGSQMLGIVFARYILKNPVLIEASIDQLASTIGPTLDRYLTSDLGIPAQE